MFTVSRRALWLPTVLVLAACPRGNKDDSGVEAIELSNSNNYSWTGGLKIPGFETAETSDIHLDFSQLTQDMLCHDMDPVADVDILGLTRFPRLSEEEVGKGLTDNSLLQADTNGYLSCEPGDATSCDLSDFNFGGTFYDAVSVYKQSGGVYLLVVATGSTPGQGGLFLAFLQPRPESTVTEVVFQNDCGVVDYTVDMESLQKLALPADGPWLIDWSNVSSSGNGQPVVPGKLDEVLVGHYTQTPAEIQGQFTDLEPLASELYKLELTGGTEADLSGLADADGGAFPGFTTDGTWVLGLRCTSCTNPAPIFLTVVSVE
jgi:hypothetical protein